MFTVHSATAWGLRHCGTCYSATVPIQRSAPSTFSVEELFQGVPLGVNDAKEDDKTGETASETPHGVRARDASNGKR